MIDRDIYTEGPTGTGPPCGSPVGLCTMTIPECSVTSRIIAPASPTAMHWIEGAALQPVPLLLPRLPSPGI